MLGLRWLHALLCLLQQASCLEASGFGTKEGTNTALADGYSKWAVQEGEHNIKGMVGEGIGIAKGVWATTFDEKWQFDRKRMQSESSIWHVIMFGSDTILGKLQDLQLGIVNWLTRGTSEGHWMGIVGTGFILVCLAGAGAGVLLCFCGCFYLSCRFRQRLWPYIRDDIKERCCPSKDRLT
jgi:hypothetical protein